MSETVTPAASISEVDAALTAAGGPFEIEQRVIFDRPVRVWRHAPNDLRQEVLDARAFGERPFLVHENDRVSFEAFYRAASAFARRLTADGVGRGDRVAVIARNLPEWVVAFYGAVMTGAAVAPLNAWWTGRELEYGVADSGARVVIADSERWQRFAPHRDACPKLEQVYTIRHGAEPGTTPLEDLLGAPNDWGSLPDIPPPEVVIDADDDAAIFYTSGTSGLPKGALATHRNITANVMAGAYTASRALLRRGLPLPAPDAPPRTYLIAVPFFHVTGFCASLQPALTRGYKCVMMRKWDTVEAFRLIERERVTNAGGVPTLAWQMLQHPEREKFDLSSLTGISYGGAPAAPELVAQLKTAFPQAQPGVGWGMSETCGSFTGCLDLDYELKPASSGLPLPVGEVRIVDLETLEDLPTGGVGELWVRGPNVVKGYLNKPEATAETFVQGGWLRTGDLASVDDEGFVYIVDRAKDVIIRGGENIYSIEVESVLVEHPGVAEAALVAQPHQVLGEEPVAVVVRRAGAAADEDELKAFVRSRLAPFKVPVRVVFSGEPLPRNANGKVMKAEVRKLI
ncbi:class I adenylate-forming enzyme family protein [Phenylobacterium sp.]|jgi:long-chain acyl-CoA synthetase|uniref:class I adenylate-forming enzyme family protein n=1 Tax=Phenylobacterium sp. TaxID=1871053 RepID=UPI003784E2A9